MADFWPDYRDEGDCGSSLCRCYITASFVVRDLPFKRGRRVESKKGVLRKKTKKQTVPLFHTITSLLRELRSGARWCRPSEDQIGHTWLFLFVHPSICFQCQLCPALRVCRGLSQLSWSDGRVPQFSASATLPQGHIQTNNHSHPLKPTIVSVSNSPHTPVSRQWEEARDVRNKPKPARREHGNSWNNV